LRVSRYRKEHRPVKQQNWIW